MNLNESGGNSEVQTFNTVENNYEVYQTKVHFWGRLTIWAVIILTLLLPMYFSFILGFHPGWDVIFTGYSGYAAMIGIAWVLEPIMYFPMLGTSGTYIGFLAGNISNMCLPCAGTAQSVVGAEPGSKKGEIVATLAIGTASIINIFFIIMAVWGGSYIISVLPESITNLFDFIVPAIFGAMVGQFAMKTPAYGVIAITVAIIIVSLPLPSLIDTLIVLVLTVTLCILWERLKNKKSFNKKGE